MAQTRAQKNRALRQKALREQLSAQGHVQYVIEIADKLADLGEELDNLAVQRLKASADIRAGLIKKYLPDLKSTEHTGEGGGAVPITLVNDFGDD